MLWLVPAHLSVKKYWPLVACHLSRYHYCTSVPVPETIFYIGTGIKQHTYIAYSRSAEHYMAHRWSGPGNVKGLCGPLGMWRLPIAQYSNWGWHTLLLHCRCLELRWLCLPAVISHLHYTAVAKGCLVLRFTNIEYTEAFSSLRICKH